MPLLRNELSPDLTGLNELTYATVSVKQKSLSGK